MDDMRSPRTQEKSCLLTITLLLLLLRPWASALISDAPPTADSEPCSGRSTAWSCSANASRISLAGRGLAGRLTLAFAHSRGSHGSHHLHLDLLNVSANPGLTGITLVVTGSPVASVHINRLDISGTAMAPVPGRLLDVATLLSIHSLIANGTAYDQPLDLVAAADLLYAARVQTFTLVGWPLANGQVPANLTSHGANSCGSKHFRSLAISRSRLVRSLTGSSGAPTAMAVSDAIDLSGNGLRWVSNVTFSAARIDLSDNELTDLPGVVFRPGSLCRVEVTGPPTLLLRQNRLAYAALDSLAASSRRQGGFSGLDLSGNERLVPEEDEASPSSNATIGVSQFLDLSGLGGHVSGLAGLLGRFRLSARRQRGGRSTGGSPAADATFRLSLADNWIPDLASAAALVSGFVPKTQGGNGSRTTTPLHLDLSGNRLMFHLNLSSLSPDLLASLTVRRLPQLRTASVRVSDLAGLHERLRGLGQPPNAALLAELWSPRVPLLMDARPSRCCLAEDSELVCSFLPWPQSGGRPVPPSLGLLCYSEEAQLESPASPELPLLFTCVILGCALLLGLMTGVAVFYARRRYSRGRYAVYSVYAVHVKEQHQSQVSGQQLPQVQQMRSPGGPVQLKTMTVCSAVLPVEKVATPV